MIDAMLSTVLSTPHVVFALQNEAAYGVIVGLAIIAALEIAAGLWMIHAGEAQHHHRR
jgi:hypothetical protein